MSDAPKLLLDHHLKTLKLPTFLREYAKLARPAATPPVHARAAPEQPRQELDPSALDRP